MFFGNINYIVIIIAAIVGMGIGVVWHAPYVFGKLWMKYKGWSDEHLVTKKAKQSMIAVNITMTVTMLVEAFVIAGIFNSIIAVGLGSILFVGFCLWLGLIVPVKLADYLYGGDTIQYFLIEAGYQLVAISAMSLIIGIFG